MPFEIIDASDGGALADLFRSGWDVAADVAEGVRTIIRNVRDRGDAALVEYTRQFDSPCFTAGMLAVSVPSREESRKLVPPDISDALELARERVEDFHRRQLPQNIDYTQKDGTTYGFHYVPLHAVGAYVPAASAPLASSVIMSVVPAKVAGVERVAVFCPPRPDGSIHPAILYASALCGVDELYAAGGAQGIAAAAFGTASIAPVDKIVGPGNRWVTEAKRQVFGACAIDGLAGPSEVLVVAEESSDVARAAWELLAQAEHDPFARVAIVSESHAFLERCQAYLAKLDAEATARGAILKAVFERGFYLIYARSRAQVFGVINSFAPEHLSLQIQDFQPYVSAIRTAGAIFVGTHTPVAAGDYIAGTNHVLPTSGSARFSSGLRTLDFMRSFSILANSEQRMAHDGSAIAALARFEGLEAHARTAGMRAS